MKIRSSRLMTGKIFIKFYRQPYKISKLKIFPFLVLKMLFSMMKQFDHQNLNVKVQSLYEMTQSTFLSKSKFFICFSIYIYLLFRYEPSRYSPQSSPFQFQSPKRQSASSKKLQTPPPSPLPNFPQTPKRPVSSSQSMR